MDSTVLKDLLNQNMEAQDSNSDDLTSGSVPCRLTASQLSHAIPSYTKHIWFRIKILKINLEHHHVHLNYMLMLNGYLPFKKSKHINITYPFVSVHQF